MSKSLVDYNLAEHRFRFAAWAAARAASAKGCRFKVKIVQLILRQVLYEQTQSWEDFERAIHAETSFDDWHIKTCRSIISKSKMQMHINFFDKYLEDQGQRFSHGIAAKLVNI